MDLAVAAYDYAVKSNQDALDYILDVHAREVAGSDSNSLVTLSYLDEWDRTIEAYDQHFAQSTDGQQGTRSMRFS